jgi:hypothetical protein
VVVRLTGGAGTGMQERWGGCGWKGGMGLDGKVEWDWIGDERKHGTPPGSVAGWQRATLVSSLRYGSGLAVERYQAVLTVVVREKKERTWKLVLVLPTGSGQAPLQVLN